MDLSICHKIATHSSGFSNLLGCLIQAVSNHIRVTSVLSGVTTCKRWEQPISWTKPVWLANTIYFLKERDKVLTRIVNLWQNPGSGLPFVSTRTGWSTCYFYFWIWTLRHSKEMLEVGSVSLQPCSTKSLWSNHFDLSESELWNGGKYTLSGRWHTLKYKASESKV